MFFSLHFFIRLFFVLPNPTLQPFSFPPDAQNHLPPHFLSLFLLPSFPLPLSHPLKPSMRQRERERSVISSLQRRKWKFKSPDLGTDGHTATKRCVTRNVILPQILWPFLRALIHGVLHSQQPAPATSSQGCPRTPALPLPEDMESLKCQELKPPHLPSPEVGCQPLTND